MDTTALSRRQMERAVMLPKRPRPRPPRWHRPWRQLLRLRHRGDLNRRLLLGAPLLAVVFAIWAFGGAYGWAYGLAYLLIFGAAAVWAAQCARGRARPRWRPVYLPMLLFGAWGLSQDLFSISAVPGATTTALLHLSAAGAVFLVVSQCYRGGRDCGWIAAGASGLTLALALLAILQILSASHGIYWHFTYTYASPAGSFVNRNHFSGCMEMLVPLAAVAAYQHRHQSWLHFLPWATAPALGISAVILAASRGGAVALAVEAGAAAVIGLVSRRARPGWASPPVDAPGLIWLPLPLEPTASSTPAATQGRARQRTLGLATACLLTIGLVALVGIQPLAARLHRTDAFAPSIEQRHLLNRSSLAMFRARPVDGWGLGTWADVYPAFARFTDPATFAFAHNDYLQMLAETGSVGAGCVLLFWGTWIGEFLGRFRATPALNEKAAATPLAIAAAIACLGLLVHSWVDFNLHIPANLLLFFALAALALPPPGATAST